MVSVAHPTEEPPMSVDLYAPVPNRRTALAYLLADGDLIVPCSRYGTTTAECAAVAWQVFRSMAAAGCDDTYEALDSVMAAVVNDADGLPR